MDSESDKHLNNNTEKPWLWKKGHSGNIHGRPKGKTMKEWAREYLERLNDEERDKFMEGISKEIIWKMAEGNPDTNADLTSKGEKIVFMPTEVLNKISDNSAQ